ncbi:uncharacterized protein LOC133303430 [Gastrolobium bilobum]|uniref:uncharacterized protein LOC133303430 n=1 Tax=Gastrolobium bilobum TaxID=150636 RepID=UPI002AB16ECF|nr:uncharacterized protein LOC133303430 [Gastrolobium bilobum]
MVLTRNMDHRMETLEARVGGTEEGVRRIETNLAEVMRTLQDIARAGRPGGSNSDGSGSQGGNNDNNARIVRNEERMKRVEVPYFSREDPYGWIFRAERYFRVNRIPPEEQLETASICLEGEALSWFQWWEPRNPLAEWLIFRTAVLQRFHASPSGNPYEALMELKQLGTVAEFRKQFEVLSAPLGQADEELMQAAFLTGLRPEIRAEIRLHSPGDIGEMMILAQRVEEREAVLGRGDGGVGRTGIGLHNSHMGGSRPALGNKGGGSRWQQNGPVTSAQSPTSNTLNTQVSSAASHTLANPNRVGGATSELGATQPPGATANASDGRRRNNFRRLSSEEEADHRRRNLCFRCGGPFGPGHVCPNPQLRVMLVSDDGGADGDEDPIQETGGEDQLETLQLSIQSVVGITSNRSLKLWGKIQGHKVMVLVDTGASHNFIGEHVVDTVGIPSMQSRSFRVEVGDGHRVQGMGVCQGVTLVLPHVSIIQDFYIFCLKGVDVVLGFSWLEGLGDIQANFGKLSLRIPWKGSMVTLQGDPELSYCQVSYKSMNRAWKKSTEGYYIELGYSAMELTGTPDEDPRVAELLLQYDDVFQPPSELPPSRACDHKILLKQGADTPNIRPYRYPYYQKEEIEKFVREMLVVGMIRPSCSPYSSPLILVKKKDGSWRFCVDYRALNKVTIPDKFPLPVIDELLDELHGAEIFSKLDLKSGYNQIRMRVEDIEKTAFRTHEGHYEYLVMPFGLRNAPSTFQSLMNTVFKPYLRKFVLVFFDDILVYNNSLDQHCDHLKIVLDVLRQNHFAANKKKCTFVENELEYLGHLISKEGVKADHHKLEAMSQWPTPTNVKGLRGFLGLTGYYRRFVRQYGQVAHPLTQLLKKDSFVWSEEAQLSFEALKAEMLLLPTLALPNFDETFFVETDASGVGMGAVLMQAGRPIAFLSKAFSDKDKVLSVYERELKAIVFAVYKWRHYLLGRHFVITTDHRSLKYLTEQRLMVEGQQKWVAKLMGYDFEIRYKPGKENTAADALSRVMDCKELTMVTSPDLQGLSEEVSSPSILSSSCCHSPGVSLLSLGWPFGGIEDIKARGWCFFWKGMRQDVAAFVRACAICQQQKYDHLKPAGLLQPLPIPQQVWEELSIDFIGGLPVSKGTDTILVVVDRLSKYAHFMTLKHPYDAQTVAAVFLREVIRLHGIPKSIVSDRDRIFMSKFWGELFKLTGTKLKFSSAYHPQTDGQTEVVNRTLETYLRCFASGHPKGWAKWLSWAEFWFNTTYNRSIQMTPFRAVYGRDPPSLISFTPGSTTVAAVDTWLLARDAILVELKQNLCQAQQRMKLQADKGRREENYVVGDTVFVKIHPYKLRSLARRINQKLSPRFYGPFTISAKIGPVAYRLELPSYSKVHPVFHVSQLKRAIHPSLVVLPLPRCLSADLELQLQPAAVLKARRLLDGTSEILVQWAELDDCDATWEPLEEFQAAFPYFHLEDKVDFEEGGIDGPLKPYVQVYSRKAHRRKGMDTSQLVTDGDTWQAMNGEEDIGEMGKEDHFAKHQKMAINLKYIDPTYMIRAVPSIASDNVYCTLLAHSAVNGAMAGYTGFIVGPVNDRHAYIPFYRINETQKKVVITDRMWARLLSLTNQPSFWNPKDIIGESKERTQHQKPDGEIHTVIS